MSKQWKKPTPNIEGNAPIEEQARAQTGQQKLRIQIDERELKSSYANGFRPTATAEEVLIDFGLNILSPAKGEKTNREMVFHANNRIIMNYYGAKRLALMLGQIVRRYEQELGELKLNAIERRKK